MFFFFQAEDGIRYLTVTGVQTCALPISWINGFARSPGQFVVLLLLVAGLTWLGAGIASQISDRMGAIWRRVSSAPSGLPDDAVYGLRSNKYYIALHEGLKRKWAPAFFALLV